MGLFGGGNSSVSTNTTENQFDQKKTVGDSGILLELGSSINTTDARDLSDNSTFSTADNSTTTTTTTDARDLSDRSSFSIADSYNTSNETTSIDSRDFSDRSSFTDARSVSTSTTDASVTYAADADTLQAIAGDAFESSRLVTTTSAELLDAALNYGDEVTARAMEVQKAATDALSVATTKSLNLASEATKLVADNAKTADQGNTEKLIKAGAAVAIVAAAAFAYAKSK